MQLLDTLSGDRSILAAQTDILSFAQLTPVNTADGNTANIFGIVERCDEHLALAGILFRAGNSLDDSVEQRQDIVGGLVDVSTHPALLGRSVECREIKLFLCSIKAEHKVEHHFLHFLGAAVGLVDFIDDHNRLQANLDCFLEHEASLRHRAFERIDKKKTAVGHIKYALNFTTEIRVSRSVDDIDFISFIIDRYVFGKNCYATLALEIVIIEDKLAGVLVLTKEVSGKKHFIDQSCFAVVHMSDNGYVAYFLHTLLDVFYFEQRGLYSVIRRINHFSKP